MTVAGNTDCKYCRNNNFRGRRRGYC